MLTYSAVLSLHKFSFGIVQKSRYAVLVTIPPQCPLLLPQRTLPLLLPRIAVAGMEDRAVVTIGGVTKARANVKVLVKVDGLVVTARQRIAAAGIQITDAELTSGVTDSWATVKTVAVGSGSNPVVREHMYLALKKGTQNYEHTLLVDEPN